MPIDQYGVRADIIFCTIATINRMNIGRTYEHYIGSTTHHVARKVTESLGFVKGVEITSEQIACLDETLVNQNFSYLLRLYQIVSKVMHEEFSKFNYELKCEHLAEVVNNYGKYANGLFLYIPIANHDTLYNITKLLAQEFPVPRGPVTYRGDSGKLVTTNKAVRIGPMYVMALDKIADDWSSVSSARLQHFGILAVSSKAERNRTPYRNNPVRTIGETEGRIYAGYLGREAIAEMIDRSNNPQTQRSLYRSILDADKPTNIDKLVNRDVLPYGGAKPLLLIKHMLAAAGFKMVYKPEGNR